MMEELNCRTVRGSLWDYSSGALDEQASQSIASHLGACRDCDLRRLEVGSLRSGLRNLPVRRAPAILNTRLLVLASRERSRFLARRNFTAWLKETGSRARLSFDNLLKPFAVPAAGGLLASFLCFGVIVDTLHVQPGWDKDMPMGLFTQVTFAETSPFCRNQSDLLVELTIDADGNVTDYSLPQGATSPAQLQEIGNLIMYSTFTPATRFGQPVASKQYLIMSHVNIRG